MTVTNTTNFKEYQADGIATNFAIPFLLLDRDDLQVYLDGILIVTGYTISGIGNPTSEIIFTTAPTGKLLLQRYIEPLRYTDYQDNGDLLAATLNQDFDRLYMSIQGQEQVNTQALRVPEVGGIDELPAAEYRANKLLAFDNSGNPLLATINSGTALDLAKDLADSSVINKGAGLIGYNESLAYPTKTVGNSLASLNKSVPVALKDIKEMQAQIQELMAKRFAILYPEGTEDNPAVITINSRKFIESPFPGHPVYCLVEIKYDDWGAAGWGAYSYGTGANTAINSYGVNAYDFQGGIAIQSGNGGVCTLSSVSGNPHNITSNRVIPSAPYRVKVWRVD